MSEKTNTENADEKIEIFKNVEPHEEENSVKSKAVVRYEAVQVPAKFTRLQCNTDLNMPPANWFSNSANSYGLQQSIYHSSGFASFHLSNMFPDCLGEVDVVSDAENIKNLLKLPYSPKSAISMMVHRIENTLLIDEFDIQRILMQQDDQEWKWLRNFVNENIINRLSPKYKNFCIRDKSRVALQEKNLLSKFLYYSIPQDTRDEEYDEGVESDQNDDENDVNSTRKYVRPLHKQTQLPSNPVNSAKKFVKALNTLHHQTPLPEPKVDENIPNPSSSNHIFNRNVVWNFEDIRMLIGTDMPIFGGGTHPCISLRLREKEKPINVLTGIDYWLDNLMCNVPEVVMCFHVDGIVQNYELIRTEDLPYLDESQFSPQIIRNVAQNILAFLKANATKAGHTYWLFKGKNDDVVKLYDLTTLCQKGQDTEVKNENPFTIPVAMLLYTVARNMKNSGKSLSAKKAGSIKALLHNCIKLLPKEKYPQIVTSSHYILSDLHIPAGIDPKSPAFQTDSDSDTTSCYDDDSNPPSECNSPEIIEEEDEEEKESEENYKAMSSLVEDYINNIAVKNIRDTLVENGEENWKNNRSPAPLNVSVIERCRISLQHIHEGLDCLKYFKSEEKPNTDDDDVAFDEEQQKQKILHEELNPNMAKPYQPIALPYERLPKKDTDNIDNGKENNNNNKKSENGSKINTTNTEKDNKIEKNESDENDDSAINSGHNSNENSISEKDKESNMSGSITKSDGGISTGSNSETEINNKPEKDKDNEENENTGITDSGVASGNSSMSVQEELIMSQLSKSFKSWNIHLRLLLLEKACLTYATMAEYQYSMENYGKSLKCIYMAIMCQMIVNDYMEYGNSQKKCLYGRAGDCFFQMAKNNDKLKLYLKQYAEIIDIDVCIFIHLGRDPRQDKKNCFYEPSLKFEQLMSCSSKCYEEALQRVHSPHDDKDYNEIVRRMGSVNNELGVFYMNLSQEEYRIWNEFGRKHALPDKEPSYYSTIKLAFDHLTKGISLFEEANDVTNLQFLFCNMGRFMRLRAHTPLENEDVRSLPHLQKFYGTAFKYYERAVERLSPRKDNPEMYDIAIWELGSAVFVYATYLQDYGDHALPEYHEETLKMLSRALKLTTSTMGPKKEAALERCAILNHRIAKYYVFLYQNLTENLKARNHHMQFARKAFEKANLLYEQIKDYENVLINQGEYVNFLLILAEAMNTKQKHYEDALQICLNCQYDFEEFLIEKKDICEKLFNTMVNLSKNLQEILKNLTKITINLTKKDTNFEIKKLSEKYKIMYRCSLESISFITRLEYANSFCKILKILNDPMLK